MVELNIICASCVEQSGRLLGQESLDTFTHTATCMLAELHPSILTLWFFFGCCSLYFIKQAHTAVTLETSALLNIAYNGEQNFGYFHYGSLLGEVSWRNSISFITLLLECFFPSVRKVKGKMFSANSVSSQNVPGLCFIEILGIFIFNN